MKKIFILFLIVSIKINAQCPGTYSVSFVSTPTTGCAPVSVIFNNNSVLGATNGTVYTQWNYGNGATNSYTNPATGGSPNGATTYTSLGNYTVTLNIQQYAPTFTCVGIATGIITVTCTTGIIEYDNSIKITVFPIPSHEIFNVSIDSYIQNAEIIVFNSVGQQVIKSKIYSGNNEITSNLPVGIYCYTISETKQIVARGKLIVE